MRKNSTCDKLLRNPEQIKRRYICFLDETTEIIYRTDVLDICEALSKYNGTFDNLSDDFSHLYISFKTSDYNAFMKLIQTAPGDECRNKFRGFGKQSTGMEIIKAFGKVLGNGDEYTFLKPVDIIIPEMHSLLDELKQDKGYKTDIINAVYQDIIILCRMLVPSSFYNLGSDGKITELYYYVQLLDNIREKITANSLYADNAVIDSLLRILDETQEMVWSCEIPNVCKRWLDVNPKLKYYSPVFDIYHNNPEIYKRIISGAFGKIHFSFIPTDEELEAEQEYRKIQEKRCKNMGETYEIQYQNEVLTAVREIFKAEYNI